MRLFIEGGEKGVCVFEREEKKKSSQCVLLCQWWWRRKHDKQQSVMIFLINNDEREKKEDREGGIIILWSEKKEGRRKRKEGRRQGHERKGWKTRKEAGSLMLCHIQTSSEDIYWSVEGRQEGSIIWQWLWMKMKKGRLLLLSNVRHGKLCNEERENEEGTSIFHHSKIIFHHHGRALGGRRRKKEEEKGMKATAYMKRHNICSWGTHRWHDGIKLNRASAHRA